MNKHSLSISNFKNTRAKQTKRGGQVRAAVLFPARLFCVFLVLLFFFGKIIMPQYLYSYNASLLDKMERLKSLTGPKIVLIGNSNLAFGIHSEMLEEAFHMPVVNMGVHGGLSNAFHEEMARVNLQEGDIIIVAHTDFDDDDSFVDPVVAWLTLENHPELWTLVRMKDLPDLFFACPNYAKRAISLWTAREGNEPDYGDVYSRVAFNEYGDVNFERKTGKFEKEDFFEQFTLYVPAVNEVCTNRLNELNRFITQRGAVMVVAGYPVMSCEYTAPAEDYIQFRKDLEDSLDCPVISDYTDYFLDYEYFYDTPYHLTDEGAALRTKQLILDLQSYLAHPMR